METVKRSVVQGLREREEQAEHRGVLGQRNYSIWHNNGGTCVQTHRMYNTKSEP